jgi:hypothetical protein
LAAEEASATGDDHFHSGSCSWVKNS